MCCLGISFWQIKSMSQSMLSLPCLIDTHPWELVLLPGHQIIWSQVFIAQMTIWATHPLPTRGSSSFSRERLRQTSPAVVVVVVLITHQYWKHWSPASPICFLSGHWLWWRPLTWAVESWPNEMTSSVREGSAPPVRTTGRRSVDTN